MASRLQDVIQRGTRAAQPAATAVAIATLYYVTDEFLVERSTGSAWESYSATTTQFDEDAQDAVGTILTDTDTIDFTYTDATPAITADVKDGSITYAKIQDVSATDKLLGRSTAGAGDVEEIACTAAGRAIIDDASAGDQRTTLGLGALATLATVGSTQIDNDAVTYAKIQNVSAASKLLGRGSAAGAGDTEEITLGTGLTMTGTTLAAAGADSEWTETDTQAADQDVTNSTTLVDATSLSIAVVANEVWLIEVLLLYSGDNGSNDFKFGFAVSAGTMTGVHQCLGLGSTDVVADQTSSGAGATTGALNLGVSGTITTPRVAIIKGMYLVSSNSNLTFQFAQLVAAPATSVRVLAGTIMRGKRVI